MVIPKRVIKVLGREDVLFSQRVTRDIAAQIGFDTSVIEELALVSSELASNLLKHAHNGCLILSPYEDHEQGRRGIQIESTDDGPGILHPEKALEDSFSTLGSLGIGLGAVNRLMDDLVMSVRIKGRGTRIGCVRFLYPDEDTYKPVPVEFGGASRPHPASKVNGDCFIIKRHGQQALVGVIDGLGHGPGAHHAAVQARMYVERHYRLSLSEIFQGTCRACRGTRGVVMELARFDFERNTLRFAGIGDTTVKVIGPSEKLTLLSKRGVVGLNQCKPREFEYDWDRKWTLVLASDGISSHWQPRDIPEFHNMSAVLLSQAILKRYSKPQDDATVVVVKETLS